LSVIWGILSEAKDMPVGINLHNVGWPVTIQGDICNSKQVRHILWDVVVTEPVCPAKMSKPSCLKDENRLSFGAIQREIPLTKTIIRRK
jgi:hypothetical protein